MSDTQGNMRLYQVAATGDPTAVGAAVQVQKLSMAKASDPDVLVALSRLRTA